MSENLANIMAILIASFPVLLMVWLTQADDEGRGGGQPEPQRTPPAYKSEKLMTCNLCGHQWKSDKAWAVYCPKCEGGKNEQN